jgi:hypothetical protein
MRSFFEVFAEFEVLFRELLHQVGEAVCDGIEFVLNGVVGAFLGVLEQRHEEECDDGGDGGDDQLPGDDGAQQEK